MTPGFPFGRGAPVLRPTVSPDWIAHLKRRQAAIMQLCRGLREHLGAERRDGVEDICESIEYLLGAEIAEQLERVRQIEANPPRYERPTLEDFDRAAKQVEQCQRGVEAVDAMIAEIPKASADFIREVQRPMLVSQLEQAQEWLSRIQKAMEEPEEPEAPGEKWTVKHKGEDYFHVLECPPIPIYVVCRPEPPGHPGETEIAENPDGSLKAFATEEPALKAASEMGEPWQSSMMLFSRTEPEPAPAESSTSTEASSQPKGESD